MKIYVYNCSNTLNYGSMMMGENFISYFNKLFKSKNEFYIETNEEETINRLKYASEFEQIFSVKPNALFKPGLSKNEYVFGYFGMKRITSDFAKTIDLVIVLGGDDFTEDYGWTGPVINGIKFNILKKDGMKVVMLGQTMGPYMSFRKIIMKRLLNGLDKIYPRDPITYNYLTDIGVTNIKTIDDLALLPLKKQTEESRTKEFITYCPSELIYRYSKEGKREEWIEFNLYMIDLIMTKYSDKKLLLLAHVLAPEHVDDRKIVEELYKQVSDKYDNRVIIMNEIMYPFEVRKYIQNSLFTISSRMHPVVSSIQCEVPTIALSYSTKYWGIIGERYELEDYILDVRYLSYDEMKVRFKYILDQIEDEYTNIQVKMREKNKQAIDSISVALQEISRLVD